MKRFYYLLLPALLCISVQNVFAQDDLSIFGYFQATFNHTQPIDTVNKKYNSFSIQQLNLFLSKPLGNDFSAFVNLEITNSFSSAKNWGSFELGEAWMKYYSSDAFSIKAGLLIPPFNNLNEIKEKSPLLPYIIRPLAYEDSFEEFIDLEDFVPQKAFLQLYGFVPLGSASLNYAVYAGNSSHFYVTSETSGLHLRGTDTTTFKMLGGRIGVEIEELKAGVSATYDRENTRDDGELAVLGDLPRMRLGGDLSYSRWGFTLEGEIILVKQFLSDGKQKTLDSVSAESQGEIGTNLDKHFYYGTLTYNISPQIYVYGSYSYLDNKADSFFKEGLTTYSIGGGYKPIDAVVIKLQYSNYKIGENTVVDFKENSYYAGVSVFF